MKPLFAMLILAAALTVGACNNSNSSGNPTSNPGVGSPAASSPVSSPATSPVVVASASPS